MNKMFADADRGRSEEAAMFEIRWSDDDTIALSGRLDASQADKARTFLAPVDGSCALDFGKLEYVSSAGLGVLIGVQRRLKQEGHGLTIRNIDARIRELFRIAGFDQIFDIE